MLNELGKLGIVTRYEFLKHLRRKRLYVILGLALVAELAVIIFVPLLTESGGYPLKVTTMAFLLTAGSSMASLGAVFFAGDAIAGEFESKTGFILFTNPVKRTTLWVGKYIACLIAVTLLMLFSYIITVVTLLAIYSELPMEILQSFGLAILFSAAFLSVTFLFSSFSKGAIGATVMTLLLVFVIFGILESILMFTDNPTWFLLSTGGDSIAMVYGDYSVLLGEFMPEGFELPFEIETMNIGLAAIAMAVYTVVSFTASIFISNRRQLA
jgi:ABC-2 type transport system permease protein